MRLSLLLFSSLGPVILASGLMDQLLLIGPKRISQRNHSRIPPRAR